jgi:hypothetical protein
MIEDLERATGRSFRIAMKCLLWASYNPGCWCSVVDHWPTMEASRFLTRRIAEILQEQGIPYEAKSKSFRILP